MPPRLRTIIFKLWYLFWFFLAPFAFSYSPTGLTEGATYYARETDGDVWYLDPSGPFATLAVIYEI